MKQVEQEARRGTSKEGIAAVIFDFDGLILDTETTLYETWCDTYREHGLELSIERWSANIGGAGYDVFHPFEALAEGYGHPKDWDAVHEARRNRYWSRVHVQAAMPGATEALAEAKALGLRIGVASSSNRSWVTGHLDRLGLTDYVDAMRGGDEVSAVKPDPELYVKVMDDLGVTPDQAFALEDSPRGISAAKAAGLYCVAVPNSVTQRLDLGPADRRVPSLAEITLADLVRDIEESLRSAV